MIHWFNEGHNSKQSKTAKPSLHDWHNVLDQFLLAIIAENLTYLSVQVELSTGFGHICDSIGFGMLIGTCHLACEITLSSSKNIDLFIYAPLNCLVIFR